MTAAEIGTEIIYLCETYGWSATEAADHVQEHGIPPRIKDLVKQNLGVEVLVNAHSNGNGRLH